MQNQSGIEHIVKDYVLREFLPGEDPAQLTNTTPLITTGILDSLATLKIVAFLETEFAISLSAHETSAEYLDTIENIAALIRRKRGEAPAGGMR
jgi:acyl carrier protein